MLSIRVVASGGLLTDPDIATRFDQEIVAELEQLGALGQRLVFEGTPPGVASGGGGLRGSYFHELRGTPARRQEIVATNLFYGEIVERGRRPGKQPPPGALDLWVQRKLSVPEGQVARVAFLVARKIARRGYAGYFMFGRAAARLTSIAEARLSALQERLRGLLGGGGA